VSNNKKSLDFIKACLRSVRPHHIAKNFLLFIPLLVGHHFANLFSLRNSLLGFLVFCFLASSAYLINDLVDLEKDKQHTRKKNRPFAAGELPLSVGFVLAPSLMIIALAISWYLPADFFLGALSYYLLTLYYTFFIKQKKWLDVILLAILYSVRVFSGMTLVENGYSPWLIVFALFLFFSLALLKRYAELSNVRLENKSTLIGRDYQVRDATKFIFLGKIGAYLAVAIFIFYIHSKKVLLLYQNPLWLWFICPCLLIWLERLWFLAKQGKILDDPVVFTTGDRFSWIAVATIVVIGSLAS
jgi:4-hydroxybenzoate polyprenyltransferase